MKNDVQGTCTTSVQGIVQKGDGIAALEYGTPTANIALETALELEKGVYAARVLYKEKEYQGALCYGVGEPPKFEVHLLDFRGKMNGERVQIEALEKVSELVEFQSKERMRQKILHDIELVRAYFADFLR